MSKKNTKQFNSATKHFKILQKPAHAQPHLSIHETKTYSVSTFLNSKFFCCAL